MNKRKCSHCKEEKSFENFGPFKGGKFGLYPVCNFCRCIKAQEDYKKQRPTYKLYYRAKRRASIKGLEFNIQESDIIIPDKCPVFNVIMEGRFAPSLDRIDSNKGYIVDNIQVISTRANTLKNNATVEELRQLLAFVDIGGSLDG